jgi:hypothetical protein
MNGEGLLKGLRLTTSCQVIAAPLHSWRGARGSGGEVCASFDAWPEEPLGGGAHGQAAVPANPPLRRVRRMAESHGLCSRATFDAWPICATHAGNV